MSLDPDTLLTVPVFYRGTTSYVVMKVQDLYNNVCLFNNQFMYKTEMPMFPTNRPAYLWQIEPEDLEYCISLMDWWPLPPPQ